MRQFVLSAVLVFAISLLFAIVALADTVTDIDGNVYQTVVIGNQVWMAENLKVTHYNNGDSIPIVIADNITWTGLTTGAACAYDNDVDNISTYGRIYNWYAATDDRNLAPAGWHVSTDDDWKQLEVYLGMPEEQVDGMGYRGGSPVGGKLKETGSIHWDCPNTSSTNETDFTALPGGSLDNRPVFTGITTDALFWTTAEFSEGSTAAWARDLTCNLPYIGRNGFAKDYGASIRCIRNAPVSIGDGDDPELPDGYSLAQNYPNPFNPVTSIEYTLPTQSHVVLEIFNCLGQNVRTLVDEVELAGLYKVEWNGTDNEGNTVTSGMYSYRLTAGEVVSTKKMFLIK